MNETIQGLWIGSELSIMEQLSIASFLHHGHPYHLYAYGDVAHAPTGTVIRDGNEILPASMIFQYEDGKSYAGFSNYFRYKLLLDHGGWWADMDIICLKSFDFDAEYVFSSEKVREQIVVASGVIKAPAESALMSFAWQTCCRKDPRQLQWGETGPRLMHEAVQKLGLEAFIMPTEVFCPAGFRDWAKVLDPAVTWTFDEKTVAIHLWNEMWRRANQDKNRRYSPDCLYESLKNRYLQQ